ncbi:type II secretion system F family protein [Candidatus Woesebacteria bacterium]|nr:type II secretion system F family protein [Candidatus Woesebacteria bacterium]
MEYSYKAIKDNKPVSGIFEADTQDKAMAYLRTSGLIILDLHEHAKPMTSSLTSMFSKVAFTDIVDMTRQLAIMLNSGLTIIDSLDILKRQASKPAYLKLIESIDSDVKAGTSFSSSLKKFPKQFNNLYIALVKAGEASGKLDEILVKLADTLEQERTFKSKIKGAMVYPAIVITAMGGVMFVMLTFVIPKLLEVYKEFNVKLPAATVFLIFISDLFANYWYIILISIAATIFLIKKAYASAAGRLIFDRIILKAPVISKVVKVAALVDTTRTLSILIAAGVSILESLDIITETTSNVIYQNALRRVRQIIEQGGTLGGALEDAKIFPPIFVQMTSVGEQTGHLDETLGHLAKYFESESEIAIKAMTTLIEPAILMVLGVGVMFVVVAVITPIFSLSSSF